MRRLIVWHPAANRVNVVIAAMVVSMILSLAAAPARARVPANPASLLADKSVLVINGTETSGDHRNARVALMDRMRSLQAEIGFQLDSASGDAPPRTFAALDAYDVIFWNYWFNSALTANPSPAFADFQNAFREWTASTDKTRGWLGVHSSGANEEDEWNWFRDSVTAMRYFVHTGPAQSGTIFRSPDTTLHDLPILEGLDTVFTTQDEWYEFDYAPLWGDTANWNAAANVRVLFYLDESTLPTALEHPMTPHPMAWIREAPNGNRFFFTSLVHTAAGANTDFMHSLLLRGLEYAAGYEPVSVRMNGRDLAAGRGLPIVRNGELAVEAAGPWAVTVHSLAGARLFHARGEGTGRFRPEALREPGVYLVRVAAASGVHVRRVLVP